jgi:type VI secretion system secreted protein VgrG
MAQTELQGVLRRVAERLVGDNPEHVTLEIDGRPYEVRTMSGREALSALYRFELVCADHAVDAAPVELVGKRAAMTLFDGLRSRRTVTGIVAEAARSVRDTGGAELRIVLVPAAFPLTLTRDVRAFIDLDVRGVVERVMQKVAAPHRWELIKTYPVRVYTSQYREDDWSFVSRLLEQEGILYWFDHEEDETVLVFSDDSRGAPELAGGAVIGFALDTGLRHDDERIFELAAEAHATATKFTVGSFDPWNPAVKVTASEGGGVHEMYDAPGAGPESPDECRRKAHNRLECALAHRAGVSGNSNTVRAVPGRVLEVAGHPAHDGRYLVREVLYEARQRRGFTAGGHAYQCHLELFAAALPFRAPEATPPAKQAGIQSARVVGPAGEEIHVDEKGRVRVQMHWDREGGWDQKAGKWLRVAQRGVASSMLYPRIGWNVMTFMEEGDVDGPSVLSRVHDAEHPPTYPLPDNKTRTVFRTATSPGGGSFNEMRFEDLAGAQEMFLNASKDMNYQVNDTASYAVGRNLERVIGNDQTWTVDESVTDAVHNDQTVTVEGDEELEVAHDRTKTVTGEERVEISGNRKLKVGSNASHNVTEDRELEVAGSVLETTNDNIKLTAENASVTIAGSVTHDVGGMYSLTVGHGYEETIGGSKREICGKDRTVLATKPATETIGGSALHLSGASYMDGSNSVTQWRVQNAMNGATPHVLVQAKKEILVVVGGSTIRIQPTSVTIVSPAYDVGSSSDIVAVTTRLTHN